MKGIKWFQRLMITALLGINAFVFMSMRNVAIEKNLIYTLFLIAFSLFLFSLITIFLKKRKKKTTGDLSKF